MRKSVLMILLLVGMFNVKAQEEQSFSDEDLTKYATVMAWAEGETLMLQNLVKDSITTWLDNSESLDISTYNELSKASDLSAVEADPEAVEAFKSIQQRIEDKKANFKEVYVGKIKSDIGVGLYNNLKKALKSDEEVKSRYEAIYEEIIAVEPSEADTEE
ncbi:hypothetical protein [Marinoscillum pacificum]|uniref:hypothetical protein n=1 Tax=Marinoscillum pacificum TaxID=392723 RepID=UPI002157299C|nr:hypothetical protein [Marinoscillum pacificum]